jgi:antitoxin ParD1/3/4
MATMNISLSDDLKAFVDEQVAEKAYSTSSEYVRELIRREREKERLRQLLLEGASSPGTQVADKAYFDELRQRVRDRATK